MWSSFLVGIDCVVNVPIACLLLLQPFSDGASRIVSFLPWLLPPVIGILLRHFALSALLQFTTPETYGKSNRNLTQGGLALGDAVHSAVLGLHTLRGAAQIDIRVVVLFCLMVALLLTRLAVLAGYGLQPITLLKPVVAKAEKAETSSRELQKRKEIESALYPSVQEFVLCRFPATAGDDIDLNKGQHTNDTAPMDAPLEDEKAEESISFRHPSEADAQLEHESRSPHVDDGKPEEIDSVAIPSGSVNSHPVEEDAPMKDQEGTLVTQIETQTISVSESIASSQNISEVPVVKAETSKDLSNSSADAPPVPVDTKGHEDEESSFSIAGEVATQAETIVNSMLDALTEVCSSESFEALVEPRSSPPEMGEKAEKVRASRSSEALEALAEPKLSPRMEKKPESACESQSSESFEARFEPLLSPRMEKLPESACESRSSEPVEVIVEPMPSPRMEEMPENSSNSRSSESVEALVEPMPSPTVGEMPENVFGSTELDEEAPADILEKDVKTRDPTVISKMGISLESSSSIAPNRNESQDSDLDKHHHVQVENQDSDEKMDGTSEAAATKVVDVLSNSASFKITEPRDLNVRTEHETTETSAAAAATFVGVSYESSVASDELPHHADMIHKVSDESITESTASDAQEKNEMAEDARSALGVSSASSVDDFTQSDATADVVEVAINEQARETDRALGSRIAETENEVSSRYTISDVDSPGEEMADIQSQEDEELEYSSDAETAELDNGRDAIWKTTVTSLQREAEQSCTQGRYHRSIVQFSNAIKLIADHQDSSPSANNDLRAFLLAKRSEVLSILGAHGAAAEDCQDALSYVSDGDESNIGDFEAGPLLKALICAQLGGIMVKTGYLTGSTEYFNVAVDTAKSALEQCQSLGHHSFEKCQQLVADLTHEVFTFQSEAKHCQEALDKIPRDSSDLKVDPFTSTRLANVKALANIEVALKIASGDMNLHEKKVSMLAALKRWREVGSHCERLAVDLSRLDGAFVEDLKEKNPFAGIPPSQSLNPNFFEMASEQTLVDNAMLQLGAEATAEAILRVPKPLLPYYCKALRLEERFDEAQAGINALRALSPEGYHMTFPWLSNEEHMLKQTVSAKTEGDALFLAGDHEGAASQYARALLIDVEESAASSVKHLSNEGGKLNAVLHCNRALCLMKMSKYQESVMECTAALKIHSHYMKAMIRRSRCYAHLERYDDSIVQYQRYLDLVQEAKRSDGGASWIKPCMFDLPRDVSVEVLDAVKDELDGIRKLKEESMKDDCQQENAAPVKNEGCRPLSSNEEFGVGRRPWEMFEDRESERAPSRSNSGLRSTGSRVDFKQKPKARGYGYSFEAEESSSKPAEPAKQSHTKNGGAAPWNAFGGRPKSSRAKRAYSSYDEDQSDSKATSSWNDVSSHDVRVSDTHYGVLRVHVNSTPEEIKKSYRKLALKFHPDKNKNDPDAADLFQRINRAYEVLSDDRRRRRYNREIW